VGVVGFGISFWLAIWIRDDVAALAKTFESSGEP
jgi:hypothetical protein